MKTIGILGAMPEEIEKIILGTEERRAERIGGVEFHTGKRRGLSLVICCAGMGKANAAAAVQLLITHFKVEMLLFSGIAGNISGRVGLGDIVIGRELLYHDADGELLAQSAPGTDLYTAHPALVDAAEQACRLVGIPFFTGRIATGDRFVKDAAVKQDIVARCHPDCVEMEGAAVAQVAMRNEVPFVVLRAMSDNCDAEFNQLDLQFEIASYLENAAAIVHAMLDVLEGKVLGL